MCDIEIQLAQPPMEILFMFYINYPAAHIHEREIFKYFYNRIFIWFQSYLTDQCFLTNV